MPYKPVPAAPLDMPDGPDYTRWQRLYPGAVYFDPYGYFVWYSVTDSSEKGYLTDETAAFFVALKDVPFNEWPVEVQLAYAMDPRPQSDPVSGAWDPPDDLEFSVWNALHPRVEVKGPVDAKDLRDPVTWSHAGMTWGEDFWTNVAGFVAGFSVFGAIGSGFAAVDTPWFVSLPATLALDVVVPAQLSVAMDSPMATEFIAGMQLGGAANALLAGLVHSYHASMPAFESIGEDIAKLRATADAAEEIAGATWDVLSWPYAAGEAIGETAVWTWYNAAEVLGADWIYGGAAQATAESGFASWWAHWSELMNPGM